MRKFVTFSPKRKIAFHTVYVRTKKDTTSYSGGTGCGRIDLNAKRLDRKRRACCRTRWEKAQQRIRLHRQIDATRDQQVWVQTNADAVRQYMRNSRPPTTKRTTKRTTCKHNRTSNNQRTQHKQIVRSGNKEGSLRRTHKTGQTPY